MQKPSAVYIVCFHKQLPHFLHGQASPQKQSLLLSYTNILLKKSNTCHYFYISHLYRIPVRRPSRYQRYSRSPTEKHHTENFRIPYLPLVPMISFFRHGSHQSLLCSLPGTVYKYHPDTHPCMNYSHSHSPRHPGSDRADFPWQSYIHKMLHKNLLPESYRHVWYSHPSPVYIETISYMFLYQ